MPFATPTLTVRDIPVHAARSLAASQPRFDMVAFHWRGGGGVRYRVRFRTGWGGWRAADGDAGTQRGWHVGELDWVGVSSGLQTRIVGHVTALRAYTIWSPVERTLARRLQLANAPPIIPRLSWGADEAIRRAPPQYAPTLQLAFVHHTAGSNAYTPAESAAIVRGIEIYHVKGNGWNDIGYNFLVDKYGQVFEGRYGGVDRNVVGAHTLGFNVGTVGVAVIGDYTSRAIPPAAAKALEQLLAWRLDLAHIDPLSFVTYVSGGNSRFPAGTPVLLRAISGHRDAYFTDCPGNALYAQLPAIARAVAATGGPKIYAPLAQTVETQTRFTARLSVAQPWTVTVTSSAGVQVAQGSGTGATVDWTWDASLAPPDRYTWTIATEGARPATGTLGSAPLALRGAAATPSTLAPGQTLTLQYTLTAPATVTATLLNGGGQTVTTLLTVQKPAGTQTLRVVPPPGLPNGPYTISLAAASGLQTASATVQFTLDDILASFAATAASATIDFTRPPRSVVLQVLAAPHAQQVAAPPVALAAGPQTVTWPALPPADYTVSLSVSDDVGTFTRTVTLDLLPPRIAVLSWKALRFRVSEPATLVLTVGTSRYRRVLSKAGVTQFRLRTTPRTYSLTATDAAGNATTIRYRR